MAQNKMVQPGIERHQDERKELARKWKGKSMERKERLETFVDWPTPAPTPKIYVLI
jgi:hypothetical protein